MIPMRPNLPSILYSRHIAALTPLFPPLVLPDNPRTRPLKSSHTRNRPTTYQSHISGRKETLEAALLSRFLSGFAWFSPSKTKTYPIEIFKPLRGQKTTATAALNKEIRTTGLEACAPPAPRRFDRSTHAIAHGLFLQSMCCIAQLPEVAAIYDLCS
jgi:hypothetical protein